MIKITTKVLKDFLQSHRALKIKEDLSLCLCASVVILIIFTSGGSPVGDRRKKNRGWEAAPTILLDEQLGLTKVFSGQRLHHCPRGTVRRGLCYHR